VAREGGTRRVGRAACPHPLERRRKVGGRAAENKQRAEKERRRPKAARVGPQKNTGCQQKKGVRGDLDEGGSACACGEAAVVVVVCKVLVGECVLLVLYVHEVTKMIAVCKEEGAVCCCCMCMT
jgi:hypothetical protein